MGVNVKSQWSVQMRLYIEGQCKFSLLCEYKCPFYIAGHCEYPIYIGADGCYIDGECIYSNF